MARAAHALSADRRVWLIDPFDDADALREAESLGSIVAVIQLLDRHARDCTSIATRLGVPLLRLPTSLPDAPFEPVAVLSRRGWREIALWWAERRSLIVAEAIGTAPVFSLGRRAGVHPLLRLTPPRSQLSPYSPEMLLVGHGSALESDAATALDEALAHSRSDLPRLLTALPRLVRG
jgi:hypothetical protein